VKDYFERLVEIIDGLGHDKQAITLTIPNPNSYIYIYIYIYI
jgi:hypothetical protein